MSKVVKVIKIIKNSQTSQKLSKILKFQNCPKKLTKCQKKFKVIDRGLKKLSTLSIIVRNCQNYKKLQLKIGYLSKLSKLSKITAKNRIG